MKLREIADLVGGELVGDGDIEITSVADISRAQPGQLAFYEKDGDLPATSASCVIAKRDWSGERPAHLIVSANPKLAFAKVAANLHPAFRPDAIIYRSAVVVPSAKIGAGVHIGPNATVGENALIGSSTTIHAGVSIADNVSIGENCVIHPNVVIYDNASIGNNVILHAGVVIGADGFGYVKDENGEYVKFPQIGTVVIEDNVEIGANTCIDRGALGETRIGEGTKIDNLVQVGHNVSVGKRCVIAAQTGISGSVTIEDDCVIGGQVGFGDHVTVKSGAVIGSQAGVLPGKIVRPGVWWGTPIQPLDEYKRQKAMIKGIGRLRDDVKSLKNQSSGGE
jgi:UDP-3-O-[3-hydroxymyristoyl] glucosamine N-acyltransferase